MKKKLAIVTTHPIQYNAPLFELLTKRGNIELKVFYTWGESVLKEKYDPGFEKIIHWDIPLLKGYSYEFLKNTAKDKGSHHFNGIVNPYNIESLKNYQPDALLVYGWAFKSHLKIVRYFKNKIPVLFRGDSTLLDNQNFFSYLKRTVFLRWVYSHVDIALYAGKNNFDYFRNAGLKKRQLVFAPHAIDNDRFECKSGSCKNEALGFRKKINIPGEDFVFLFAGKIEPKKDPATLLNAFVTSGFDKDVHLAMVGNGELEKELKKNYGNYCNIHFVDFQNQLQMPAVYEAADVFVLPSKGPGETWGLSVNEAMANGKPVIVSDKCGCAADLVQNGLNGYIFKANQIEDLRDKLKLIDTNKNSLDAMQLQSKNKIEKYSLSSLAHAVENTVVNICR